MSEWGCFDITLPSGGQKCVDAASNNEYFFTVSWMLSSYNCKFSYGIVVIDKYTRLNQYYIPV